MHIDPSPEDLKTTKFKVVNWNKAIWKTEDYPWGKKTIIQDCIDITKRDQFGLSLVVVIAGKKYFLKLPPGPKISQKVGEKDIQEHYALMRRRFEDEFKKWPTFEHIIERCRGAKFSIARPVAYILVPTENDNIELPGLIYDFVPGDDLSKDDALGSYPRTSDSFLEFAFGLTRVVQLIHNQGVLHSFLVPRNIIRTKENRNIIVGFGYSSFYDSKLHAPVLKVSDTDRCYRAPECNEKENLGALWFPVDIYSIGAILYQIATGHVPNTVDSILPKDVNRLKEHIYNKLSAPENSDGKPSAIFTENENILKILDRCLRYHPEDRFSCAEELLEALNIAKQATGQPPKVKPRLTSPNIDIHRALVGIAASQPPVASDKPPQNLTATDNAARHQGLNHLFDTLLRGWADKAVEDAERMQRHHYEIYGHRDVLVTSLCRLLAGAQDGDIYRTMTLPSYWTDANLGSNGRFLTMNKHMARKGIKIERIFLVNKEFHELTEQEQEILEFQLEAQKNINKTHEGNFKVMVKEIKGEKDLIDFETNGTLVAYLSSDKGDEKEPPKNALCLNFVSHGHYQSLNGCNMIVHAIKKIRYWIPSDDYRKTAFHDSHVAFMDKWQNAISLEEYIGKHTVNSLEELISKGKTYLLQNKEVISRADSKAADS